MKYQQRIIAVTRAAGEITQIEEKDNLKFICFFGGTWTIPGTKGELVTYGLFKKQKGFTIPEARS